MNSSCQIVQLRPQKLLPVSIIVYIWCGSARQCDCQQTGAAHGDYALPGRRAGAVHRTARSRFNAGHSDQHVAGLLEKSFESVA